MGRWRLGWLLPLLVAALRCAPGWAQAVPVHNPACLSVPEVAALVARDMAPRLNEVPFRLALRLPLPRESDAPPELLEAFGDELVRALRNSGRVAKLIERRRLAEIGRELRQYLPADWERLGRDLEVGGIVLLSARPDGEEVRMAADAIELGNRATGQSIATSQSYCIAFELRPLPLGLATQQLAKRAIAWAEAVGTPIGPRTRIEPAGVADVSARRLFNELATRLQQQGDARTDPVALLRVRIDLHAGAEGMVDAHVSLLTAEATGHLVERIREAGFTAPLRREGRLRGEGRAIVGGELDPLVARQAAKAQARADIVRQALGEPAGSEPPVDRIGEARRLLAVLSRGLTFRETWSEEPSGPGQVAVTLEAEVQRLDPERAPRLGAEPATTTLTPGQPIEVVLRAAEPLDAAVYLWLADGKVLRAFPETEEHALRLVPGKPLRPRFADNAPIEASLMPGTVVNQEAVVVVASRGPYPWSSLAPAMGDTVEESMARALPVETFLDRLAVLDPQRLRILVLPYEVVAER